MDKFKQIIKSSDFWIVTLFAVLLNIAWGAGLKTELLLNSNLLPGLNWSVDPSLYQNDLMRYTFEHNYSFHYLIPFWLAKVLPIKAIVIGLFLIQNFLGVYAVYYLAKYLFNNRSVGYLSLFFLFPGQTLRWALGASAPFGVNIFPGIFAIPLLLFCMLYFFNKRYLAAFLLLGITFNFHGAHTAFVLCMFIFYFLFNFNEFKVRDILKYLLVFTICTLPLFAWMFFDTVPTSGNLSAADWILFTKIRRSHHSYPFGFYAQYEAFVCLLALLPIAWLARPSKYKQKVLNAFGAAVIFMLIIGTVFTEIWTIPAVVKFSFFRSTRFFVIILMMYLANFIVKTFRKGRLMDCALLFLIVQLIGNLNFQTNIGGNAYVSLAIILGVSLGFLASHYQPKIRVANRNIPTLPLVFISVAAVILIFYYSVIKPLPAFAGYPVLNLYRYRMYFVAGFWTVLLFSAVCFNKKVARKTAVIALVISIMGTSLLMLWHRPMDIGSRYWYDLQIWFSENTPKESLVLIPPDLRGFRSFSKRAPYVTWFDADFLSYMPFLGQETTKRLATLGYDFKRVYKVKPERGWALPMYLMRSFYYDQKKGLTYKRLAILSRVYHIDYMITETRHKMNFPVVYRNPFLQVYRVNLSQSENSNMKGS